MLEVLERFPSIGTIQNYEKLSSGERALYNQHTLKKMVQEKNLPAIKIEVPKKKAR